MTIPNNLPGFIDYEFFVVNNLIFLCLSPLNLGFLLDQFVIDREHLIVPDLLLNQWLELYLLLLHTSTGATGIIYHRGLKLKGSSGATHIFYIENQY